MDWFSKIEKLVNQSNGKKTKTNIEHYHSQSPITQKQALKYQQKQQRIFANNKRIKLRQDSRIAFRENKTKQKDCQNSFIWLCRMLRRRFEKQITTKHNENSIEKRYQKLPKKCQIPCVRGQEQSGEFGLELLVRRVNSVRRLVLQHDLRRFELKRHRPDEVNVDRGIVNKVKRRFGVAVISRFYETLRKLRFIVHGKNLSPKARTRIRQHHHFFVLFLGTYEFWCFVL